MAIARRDLDRPAFYALRSGGARDILTLLHPPYTAWHLSYVALGAAVAPRPLRRPTRRGAWRLLSRRGCPPTPSMSSTVARCHQPVARRAGLAGRGGLAGAVAIGVGGVLISPLLVILVILGMALVPVYNLELLGGRLHTDTGSRWPGVLSRLHGLLRQRPAVRPAGVLVAAACYLLSLAQRRLSTPVRELAGARPVAGSRRSPTGPSSSSTARAWRRRSKARSRRCGWRWCCWPWDLVALRLGG